MVSVGNLNVGGRGKTPVVAAIARLLKAHGERPAILSRGYGRRDRPEGVTVVSDGSNVFAGVNVSGDEPLMLARTLPGVAVLVAADRYLAGQLAESRFGATVHVLDDGFQHVTLARDVDLLMVDEEDLDDQVLPAGRLREPVEAIAVAHALLHPVGSATLGDRVRSKRPGVPLFGVRRSLGDASWITGGGGPTRDTSIFVLAGIASPQRFVADLRAAGWKVAGSRTFQDHHWFTASEIETVSDAARAAGASAIVTTEKDAVRLQGLPTALPIAAVPLQVEIEPPFDAWLLERVRALKSQSRKPKAESPKPDA